MLALIFVLVVALLTVAAAELVRHSCRRMLAQPVERALENAQAPAN